MSLTSSPMISSPVSFRPARSNERPTLSIVVTSRNDDHGGSLLRRMQIFVDGLMQQSRRYRLDAELVLVEWNPPSDRPRFAEALDWSRADGSCRVRIIEVPPAVHQQFAHADVLPLYQMIAKNVGIRRARGDFVLATNIDVLFSDSLSRFLAARRLQRGRLYRVDRFDVAPDVPLAVPVAQQLEFCRRNTLRRSGKYAIHDYTTGERHQVQEPHPLMQLFVHYVSQGSIRRGFRTLLPPMEVVPPPIALFAHHIRRGSYRRAFRMWSWDGPLKRREQQRQPQPPAKPKPRQRPRLHLNACGDFTLLARDDWFAQRGYAELDLFSWHLDSLFCYAAHFNGLRQVVLRGSKRLYHIEHSTGSGWTMDGEAQLFARLEAAGIPWLSSSGLYAQADAMPHWQKPILYNPENWGMVDLSLPETVIC